MPSSELSDIIGLDDRRRALLHERLGVATCYDLIIADRHRVLAAFTGDPDPPDLEEIARWQDQARRRRSVAARANGWEQVAAFVVSFERREGDPRHRRVVCEQTEVEPEGSPRAWDGWDCEELCRWLRTSAGDAAGD